MRRDRLADGMGELLVEDCAVCCRPWAVTVEREAGKLFAIMASLKARGISIIYISHFLEECKRIADRYKSKGRPGWDVIFYAVYDAPADALRLTAS